MNASDPAIDGMKNKRLAGTLLLVIGLSGLLPNLAAQDMEPIRYNADELVEIAVLGCFAPPLVRDSVYPVEADGQVRFMPGTGSITYNFRTGDSAVDMVGNHVEPAVSLYNPGRDNSRTGNENRSLNALSTIGSRVRVDLYMDDAANLSRLLDLRADVELDR